MAFSVLITQCLQRDFVEPVEAHQPLPNKLHVGRDEAIRLMGHDPQVGPVAQIMYWARRQPEDSLQIIHIRDWHDDGDARQRGHLERFGSHCIGGTPGAALVLGLDDEAATRPNEHVVDSIALNDFEDTELDELFERIQESAGGVPIRVGVIGVWTEAKVSFLLYDLKTRCRIDQLATCSALTASASRAQHFNALDQLQKILGVAVFDAVGEFADWLRPGSVAETLKDRPRRFEADIEIVGDDVKLDEADREVLGFLYRDSSAVTLDALGGGFSGALVFRASSRDALGHEQAPSVAKIGPRKTIGTERASFERVEGILGNNAPSVRGFVDLGERAGIKYSYAAMGRGGIRTFKSLYESGLDQNRIDEILREVFGVILEPFYAAAHYERLPLLEHYSFAPQWADDRTLIYTADGGIRRRSLDAEMPEAIRFTSRLSIEEREPYRKRSPVRVDDGNQPARGILNPVDAPDGRGVAFGALGDLWLRHPDGLLDQLTADVFIERDPAFTPDGKSLAFISDRSGSTQVWVRDLKTSEDRQVTNAARGVRYPTFSPDGKRIAYQQIGPTGMLDFTLHVLELSDGTSRRLRKAPPMWPGAMAWSGNGKNLIVSVMTLTSK